MGKFVVASMPRASMVFFSVENKEQPSLVISKFDHWRWKLRRLKQA